MTVDSRISGPPSNAATQTWHAQPSSEHKKRFQTVISMISDELLSRDSLESERVRFAIVAH